MLPLSLLNSAQGSAVLVELKNGETFNGLLVNCDSWMNINLKEVICTAPDGARFWKVTEIYIRGNTIKYLRIPDEIIDKVKQDQANQKETYKREGGGDRGHRRGGRGGGGRGGGGRGGKRGGGGGDRDKERSNK